MKKAELIEHLRKSVCRHCHRPLLTDNETLADGCPCNSGRGINHGLVPKHTCTCKQCDPAQTGGARPAPTTGVDST